MHGYSAADDLRSYAIEFGFRRHTVMPCMTDAFNNCLNFGRGVVPPAQKLWGPSLVRSAEAAYMITSDLRAGRSPALMGETTGSDQSGT
jgi:hypothetical protein